jgi:hypothetical protein
MIALPEPAVVAIGSFRNSGRRHSLCVGSRVDPGAIVAPSDCVLFVIKYLLPLKRLPGREFHYQWVRDQPPETGCVDFIDLLGCVNTAGGCCSQQQWKRYTCQPHTYSTLSLKLTPIICPRHVPNEICRTKSLRNCQQNTLIRTIFWRLTFGPVVQDRTQSPQIYH